MVNAFAKCPLSHAPGTPRLRLVALRAIFSGSLPFEEFLWLQ